MSGGRIKKTSYTGGYGYCGWHITWDNKKVYLRSMLEKVYALYLDEQKIYYLTEKQTYQINKITYKPDFFIYKDNNYIDILKIVEIKGDITSKNTYEGLYTIFFNSINIEYQVEKIDDRQYRKKYNQETEDFIKQSTSVSMKGECNPRYGVKFTAEQSRKHSIIQKEIQSRPEVIKKKKEALKDWHANNKDKFQKIALKREEVKRKKKEIETQKILGLLILITCKYCGKIYTKRELDSTTYCRGRACTQKYLNDIGYIRAKHTQEAKNKSMYNRLLVYGKQYHSLYDDMTFENITKFKLETNRPNIPFSIKAIIKYFGTIDNFNKVLVNED